MGLIMLLINHAMLNYNYTQARLWICDEYVILLFWSTHYDFDSNSNCWGEGSISKDIATTNSRSRKVSTEVMSLEMWRNYRNYVRKVWINYFPTCIELYIRFTNILHHCGWLRKGINWKEESYSVYWLCEGRCSSDHSSDRKRLEEL